MRLVSSAAASLVHMAMLERWTARTVVMSVSWSIQDYSFIGVI